MACVCNRGLSAESFMGFTGATMAMPLISKPLPATFNPEVGTSALLQLINCISVASNNLLWGLRHWFIKQKAFIQKVNALMLAAKL